MEKGVEPQNFKKTVSILDENKPLKPLVNYFNPNDIILIAGKGHVKRIKVINEVRHISTI